jgi:hypothetical protein
MKHNLPLSLFILATVVCYAQENKRDEMIFSVGITSYSVFGSQVDLEASYPGAKPKINSPIGFRVDFGYKRLMTKSFFVQSGLSVVQKKLSQTGTGFVDNARIEKVYLAIPILVGLQGSGGKTRVGIDGGLILNKEMVNGNSTSGSGWIGNSFETKTFVPSAQLGTSLQRRLNASWSLNFRLLYELDLGPYVKRTNYSDKEYQIKTRGLSITVGICKIK